MFLTISGSKFNVPFLTSYILHVVRHIYVTYIKQYAQRVAMRLDDLYSCVSLNQICR